jgi:hypothetical protein
MLTQTLNINNHTLQILDMEFDVDLHYSRQGTTAILEMNYEGEKATFKWQLEAYELESLWDVLEAELSLEDDKTIQKAYHKELFDVFVEDVEKAVLKLEGII